MPLWWLLLLPMIVVVGFYLFISGDRCQFDEP